jgi:nitrous oxidase accessory protein
MLKRMVSGIMLTLFLIGMLTLAFNIEPVKTQAEGKLLFFDDFNALITVPDDYPTIQEAINNANEGDTIFVRAGTYYGHVIVNKTVSLIGEGANLTVINGNGWGRTVVVTANNVSISNFRIEEGGFDIFADDCNLYISGSNTKILNNDIVSCLILVYVESTSFGNTIEHNNMAGGARGLLLHYSSGNTIAHNHIAISGLCNVQALGSNNTIHDNYIRNEGGWPLLLGERSNVSRNTIVLATPWYQEFSCIKIMGNQNTITNNNIISNATGITVECFNNTIYHNNFFNYIAQVNTTSPDYMNTWDNGYPSGGNYWSDYNGTDFYTGPHQNITGSDGLGDMPYTIDENNKDRYPLMKPALPVPWEITGPTAWVPDGKCDMRDIGLVASLFGSVRGDGTYDRRADITGPVRLVSDNKIDMRDIGLIARHFGETYP